ncbi:MAG: ribose 5-phosphate isomerase B [Prevotellaceae bacterium]|jgi:ribose 5-phosphate isomerase B|nr:ribose 5-phosphate isomerase B [Prevotellaceae bacterium]
MLIGIAADHAGVEMKAFLKKQLEAQGYEVRDFGAYSCDSVDYPDFAHPLAEALSKGTLKIAVSICGSGNGISMTMNRHCGVRAALCWLPEIARLARAHNDANVCSLPARFVDYETAQKIVETFLSTAFEGGRHQRRIEKIEICEV